MRRETRLPSLLLIEILWDVRRLGNRRPATRCRLRAYKTESSVLRLGEGAVTGIPVCTVDRFSQYRG
jgi:hypothetical protein